MTHTEIVWTCIGFGVLVLVCCIIMALGLCKMAGREVPRPDEHSCNCGEDENE